MPEYVPGESFYPYVLILASGLNYGVKYRFKNNFINLFNEVVIDIWKKKEKEAEQQAIDFGKVVQELRERKQAIKEKLLMVSSKEAVSMLEEELQDLEAKIAVNTQVRDNSEDEEQNIDLLITYSKYFMEHLEELLIAEDKPEQQKLLFQLLFEERPTFNDLVSGTPNLACIYELNVQSSLSKSDLVIPRGFEPLILWLKTRCPRPLDDGTG